MKASLRVLALGALLSACSFEPPADVPDDDDDTVSGDAGVDAPPEDEPTPAQLSTSQSPHSFGDVTVGQTSALLQVVVQNSGETESGAVAVSLGGAQASAFEIMPTGDATDCAGRLLGPSETCIAQVRFSPDVAEAAAATLVVAADPGGEVSVDLTGNGLTSGALEITAGAEIDFGVAEIGTTTTLQSVTVRNSGGSPTASLTVALGDVANYTKMNDTCGGAPLAAGGTCTVSLRFNPATVGALPTQLSVRESATVGVAASVTGSGSARVQVDRTGGGTITSNPSGIDCGTGAGCTGSFVQTPITLTAQPATGWAFEAWSGPCSGASQTCSVPLSSALSTVGATFRQLACTPSTIVCDNSSSHYVECDATGSIAFEMQCPLGCAPDAEKCVDVDPSNGVAAYLDMTPNGPDVTFAAGVTSTINTSTGDVFNGPTSIPVPNEVVGNYRVFMFKRLSVAGTLRITGSRPAIILVDGTVSVTGTIDAGSYVAGSSGPGASTSTSTSLAKAPDAGGASASPGAGGGGGYSVGAKGGASGAGAAGGNAGNGDGTLTLEPLKTGGAGGLNAEGTNLPACWTNIAMPGGALQITSRTGISITGSGVINASGSGGHSRMENQDCGTWPSLGGGGGGGGGSVLLEAPQIELSGAAVVISTKGGGGAAAGIDTQSNGQDGGIGASAANGGTRSGYASGGKGGTATGASGAAAVVAPTSGAAASTSTADGGGGGGAVGKARFNTSSGTINPQGAAIRSFYSTGEIRTRQVPVEAP